MATNNNIAENLKKYFYSGIGFASHASELIQRSMDEYVKAGRVSEGDGKKIMGELSTKIEEGRAGVDDKYNEAVHKFISLSSQEISMLQKKVGQLESQLKAKGSKGKATISKSPARPVGSVKSIAKKAVKAVGKKNVKAVAKKAVKAVKKAVKKK
jgi:polyhydroxyalkanoate synthesis regulator phasin